MEESNKQGIEILAITIGIITTIMED